MCERVNFNGQRGIAKKDFGKVKKKLYNTN